MSESIDHEDIQSLVAKIQQHDLELVRIKELHEELEKKCKQNADDHKQQLDLRFELLSQLRRLLVTGTNGCVAKFQDVLDGGVGDSDGCFSQRDDRFQDAERLTPDTYFSLTELAILMTQHCEQMKGLADAHEQLRLQERELLQQLEAASLEKSSAIAQIQTRLTELTEDHFRQLTESTEKQKKLEEAYEKLAESKNKIDHLSEDLRCCKMRLETVESEKNIALAQLQTTRELDLMTKQRELKQLNMVEEVGVMMSSFQENAVRAFVDHIKKQDKPIELGNSKDVNKSGELERVDPSGSSLPDNLERLKKNYKLLTEKLEAKKVAALMYQHSALTLTELQSIQQCSTPSKAAEDLIEIILQVGEEQVYDCFMIALQETTQQHIWSWLSYDDYDIDSDHVRLIQSHYSFLVEYMDDPEDSRLIAHLRARDVIDNHDKDYLESGSSRMRRNEMLLSMLGRRSNQQFGIFLDGLCATGQRHIVSTLRGDTGLPDEIDSSERPSTTNGKPLTAKPTAGNSTGETTTSSPKLNHQQTSAELAADESSSSSQLLRLLQATAQLTADESSSSSQVLRLQQVTAQLTADKSSGAVVQHVPTSQVQQTTAKRNAASHVISSDGRGAVAGVAIYRDKLFVLRGDNEERIEQFDVNTFQQEKFIKVNGLSDGGGWLFKSMTSCDINSCLYIADKHKVFRVNPSTEDVISWPVDGLPCGLSVNETRNVLVSCDWDNTIKEYTTRGSFVRSIKLLVNRVMRPLHCIQLTDSRYVVCHMLPVPGLREIDVKHGTLIAAHRNTWTTKLEMNWPRCVILFNDSLLVADVLNDRILLLNTSLRDARPLSLPVNSQLRQPLCMYLEQSRGRLFVGEESGRVLVIDNIDLK